MVIHPSQVNKRKIHNSLAALRPSATSKYDAAASVNAEVSAGMQSSAFCQLIFSVWHWKYEARAPFLMM
jgi:hypothetical protein